MTEEAKVTPDRMIYLADLERELNRTAVTIRRWRKAKKIPPPDIHLSRECVAWRLSTLHKAGILLL